MEEMESLEGIVSETTFRNDENGYTVLRIGSGRSEQTVVGILPELSPGENVVFHGQWGEHSVYGKQFMAKSCSITPPEGCKAIEKYLGSGLIRGIGPATAKTIVKKFGEKTLEILDSSPERLSEVSGIGKKRALMIAESYMAQMNMRRTLVFLQNYGISPNLSMKIAKFYGETTIEKIRENPYRMVLEIDGVGFLTADRIAVSMGLDPQSSNRIRAALHYLLSDAAVSCGHTYLPCEELIAKATQLLKAKRELVEKEISQCLILRSLIAFSFSECDQAVCLPSYYYAEAEISQRMARLLAACPRQNDCGLETDIAEYEKKIGVRFSNHQKDAIRGAVREGVLVITGGPGTGKTTIIRCILHLLTKAKMKTLLCAPTGRAAKRIQETTGEEAKTIHRLLEYGGEDGCFARDEDCPLEADCIIVDEVSMVDVFLMRSLLRAIPIGSKLILVGDADQLPSVGAGNVLRDILESTVIPMARLTEIFRQSESSMIVWNAHLINNGEMPVLRNRNTDFFFEKRSSQTAAAQTITELYCKRLPKYIGLEGEDLRSEIIRNIQVLSPMKKGDCGSFSLNKLIQNTVNPERPGVDILIHGETEFRTHDKVIQMKNDYQLEYKRHTPTGIEEGCGVFNGDVGYIVNIDPSEHMMMVCFDDDRFVNYQKNQLDALELAYCLTVHKSQGSEFPVVILPVVGGPPMLMARNLLYTALTRAKRLVVLVGREEVIDSMVRNNYVFKRYTTLLDRLRQAVVSP